MASAPTSRFNRGGDLIPVFSLTVLRATHLVGVVEPLGVALDWSELLVPEHKQRGRHKAEGTARR